MPILVRHLSEHQMCLPPCCHPASPADFVEIMAPIVSAQFLVQLRTLLEDSYTGEQGRRQCCLRSGSALSNAQRARSAKPSLPYRWKSHKPAAHSPCCRLGAGLFLTLCAGLPKQQHRHH